MPNLEFDVAHSLHTPGGNISLNTATGDRYLIQSEDYKIIPSLRVTQDNISQADGSVLHPHWKTGLVATITVSYMQTSAPGAEDRPACGADLRLMHEALICALNSIRRLTGAEQRLLWQPTGYGDQRMLDQIQLLSWPDPKYDLDGTEALVSFAVESPFPYAIDATQTTTPVGGSAGGTVLVTNSGNADFSPVVQVNGPFSSFVLKNITDLDPAGNPLQLVYNAALPGGVSVASGHYAEIDFFRGTVYLDGDGANLIGGIDPTQSDFWHLLTDQFLGGPNIIQLSGAPSGQILSNNAWA